jgi:predicted nuclease with RNAse H fold
VNSIYTDNKILAKIKEIMRRVVAIDAPLSLPLGKNPPRKELATI